MRILKFGGSSVGDAKRIASIVEILTPYFKGKENFAVVFSAMKGVTDTLLKLSQLAIEPKSDYEKVIKSLEQLHFSTAEQLVKGEHLEEIKKELQVLFDDLEDVVRGIHLIKECTPRTRDFIMSFGERLSNSIIANTLRFHGFKADFCDSRKLVITDDHFGSAKVNFIETNKRIRAHFKQAKSVQVVTGYIGSTSGNETTTLGRGGSDYTASILGAALNASEIEIWTDVNGILTADPNKVADAFSLKAVTYEEATELSHFGAKVIHPPTMLPAEQKNIKIRIKNTFNPQFQGTVIIEREPMVRFNLKGISSVDSISFLRIEGSAMITVEGISARIFTALSTSSIRPLLITQGSSGHNICIAVAPENRENAVKAIKKEFKSEMLEGIIQPIDVKDNLSVIAVVGEDMQDTPGVAGKVFAALGNAKVNVHAIVMGSSQLNISMVVKKKELIKALAALHKELFTNKQRKLNT